MIDKISIARKIKQMNLLKKELEQLYVTVDLKYLNIDEKEYLKISTVNQQGNKIVKITSATKKLYNYLMAKYEKGECLFSVDIDEIKLKEFNSNITSYKVFAYRFFTKPSKELNRDKNIPFTIKIARIENYLSIELIEK